MEYFSHGQNLFFKGKSEKSYMISSRESDIQMGRKTYISIVRIDPT
jgi:hypothetical protein